MKLLLLSLAIFAISANAMQKSAKPMVKSVPKYKRLTVEDSRFFKMCSELLKKPIAEEDIELIIEEGKSSYEETLKEKARQYGQEKPAQEIAQPSRDHALHEGVED